MTAEGNINVAPLPTIGFGSRAPLWWGQVYMMCIEGTIFVILVASYFFVRIGFTHWPPPSVIPPALGLPTFNILLLLASVIPMYLAGEAALKGERGKVIVNMMLNIVMALGFLFIRLIEFNRFSFKWTTDIYGSFVWIIVGLHTMHAIADTVQSMVVLLIVLLKRVDEKQLLGIKIDGLYWYFVVGTWVPLYLLVYVYPNLQK
ncbi:MAG TPA: cytochrome c oxidase subunit 3 [Bryobacteraceae bacterium]|nr:cytochrome c oxidase subunit 3 [Bryobacteraceae bacterium]